MMPDIYKALDVSMDEILGCYSIFIVLTALLLRRRDHRLDTWLSLVGILVAIYAYIYLKLKVASDPALQINNAFAMIELSFAALVSGLVSVTWLRAGSRHKEAAIADSFARSGAADESSPQLKRQIYKRINKSQRRQVDAGPPKRADYRCQ